jgi:uncharacterized protein (DUF362 family)
MSKKNSKNNLSGITKLYVKWGHNSLFFTLICIGWLVWRVGTKPSRLNYPCSQFALAQTIIFFSTSTTPVIVIIRTFIRYIREREYGKIARIALIIAILISGSVFYKYYKNNQLMIAGSGTIPAPSAAVLSTIKITDPSAAYQPHLFPSDLTNPNDAVVSFSHDALINYGGSPPYDQAVNPAYDFVWNTVERLQLGTHASPLENIIAPGNTVLIKPNWVTADIPTYTRPEVVRPLIDMAIAAGATTIYIGDGADGGTSVTNSIMTSTHYTDMVNILASRTGKNIQTVNLNARDDGWHWVYLSDNSSFAGSGIPQSELATLYGTQLYDSDYYKQPDSYGYNPSGNCTGWYALNDKILDADVIINVPKMKCHGLMIATLSIKNLVGCTLDSTYSDGGDYRIAHRPRTMPYDSFTNDIFWRAILDMNKIVLYADENGVMQPTQQRKYLTVIDAIQAKEVKNWGSGDGVDTHVVLASVNPVAADAVGCRVMGYKYNLIPSIGKANQEDIHPVGTNNPENITVVGYSINSTINHVFAFNDYWSAYAGDLAITDFTPPVINSTNIMGTTVTANITGGLAAYVLYQSNGTEYIEKMSQAGNIYSAAVPSTATQYKVLAQDAYFNTAQSTTAPIIISVTITDNGATGLNFGNLSPGDVKQHEAASPSITITTAPESSNVEVYLKGTDFTGAGTFSVANAFYNNSNNSSTALAMSTSYDATAWQTLTPGATLNIYHWLSIPALAPDGNYSSTFTYKAQEAP